MGNPLPQSSRGTRKRYRVIGWVTRLCGAEKFNAKSEYDRQDAKGDAKKEFIGMVGFPGMKSGIYDALSAGGGKLNVVPIRFRVELLARHPAKLARKPWHQPLFLVHFFSGYRVLLGHHMNFRRLKAPTSAASRSNHSPFFLTVRLMASKI
jgi:hypothetical protein